MLQTCSKISQSIRIENLTTYILINAMEFSYIFIDLVFGTDNDDHAGDAHAGDDHAGENVTFINHEH
jgi:hypothetical protein